jgi:hypothetical protein
VSAHDARDAAASALLLSLPWRVGGSVGRTVYAVREGWHDHARDDDALMIGVMDTEALATDAVNGHNMMLSLARGEHRLERRVPCKTCEGTNLVGDLGCWDCVEGYQWVVVGDEL